MVDERINALIAENARSWGNDLCVIEIGAGLGALTKHLLKSFTQVHAIERDRDLVPLLRQFFEKELSANKLVLYEADAARFDLSPILSFEKRGVLVGNVPYHLTSTFIIMALLNYKLLHGAVFLVQKEVALRLAAQPDCKEYGFLSAVLNLAFKIELGAYVSKNSFWPVPKVDSAIIKLSTEDRGISKIENIKLYLDFVRSIFQKRRKKLSTILGLSKSELALININADLRPENLQAHEFMALFNYVSDHARRS
jgi:16S rRNA (adenine1518-N6/adenine1519-N6)-dimethyltransferase